jgi:ribosome-associated protein
MRVAIPEAELQVRATRAGGPGGQHVNKVATRVEVVWDPVGSPSLTDEQRIVLLTKLGNRLDSNGLLHVVARDSRSQTRNRETAIRRLQEIVDDALTPVKQRIRTRRPRAADEARLAEKKKQAEKKARRKAGLDEE